MKITYVLVAPVKLPNLLIFLEPKGRPQNIMQYYGYGVLGSMFFLNLFFGQLQFLGGNKDILF